MFTSKKQSLFDVPTKKVATSDNSNPFIQAGLKTSAETVSGNGALKYSTTGNPFIDQFGKIGSYKAARSFAEISQDCETLWAKNKTTSVLFTFYLRMISRQVQFFDGSKTETPQKGAEMKHEGIMRMIWLHLKDETLFWNNIQLFIAAGSWKDIIVMLQYDLIYNGWNDRKLNWSKFSNLILSGLENDKTRELLKKYLPQIKAKSACKTVESQADTLIAKWICSQIFGNKEGDAKTYKAYRLLKSSGTAHQWQQLISKRQYDKIDFASIHGRALKLLTRSKWLKNSGLEQSYTKWITKPETEAKWTGFVHELFDKLPKSLLQLESYKAETINKQFLTAVNKVKSGESTQTELIVVRDTSGSMGSQAPGSSMTCYDIGKALALYFSQFLTGKFSNSWIEFNYNAKMHQWIGNSPIQCWYNDPSSCVGSTNFQSVISLLCQIKQQGVPESEFPKGILCISDLEFNPTQLGRTNVDQALRTLRSVGFSDEYVDNFVIVLWNLQNNYYGKGSGSKFETYGDVKNVFYFSGYSASTVSFLTQKIKTASELFDAAMDQEVLNMIQI